MAGIGTSDPDGSGGDERDRHPAAMTQTTTVIVIALAHEPDDVIWCFCSVSREAYHDAHSFHVNELDDV